MSSRLQHHCWLSEVEVDRPDRHRCQQSPSGARGAVIGTGTFTSFVENMDRSLAFYRDAFGMDVPALPGFRRKALRRG